MDSDFSEIDSLASEEATATLVSEAAYLGVTLGEEFTRQGGHNDKAFKAFLDHRPLFDRVLQLTNTEGLPAKYWYIRNDLPEVAVRFDDYTLLSLGSTLRYYFKEAESRGHVCVVEPCQREGAVYFFCYLEDFGRSGIGFGVNDKLEKKVIERPAFEVIFLVSPQRRSLDIFYEGPRTTIRTLERIFARVVFGFDLPERRDSTVYELNLLKDRNFHFVWDPTSGITDVLIRHLRFTAIGGVKRRALLEADSTDSRGAVHDFMDDVFDTSDSTSASKNKLPLAAYNITQARMQVTFQPIPRRKPPSKTFNVSFPNGCSLGHEGQEGAIREMLRLSGIERQPEPGPQGNLIERP